jgi:hypothetical protein
MGFSGAGVHRVDAGGRSFVLKIARDGEEDADWRRTVEIQRAAALAGLTPRVVHVDDSRRAVLTDFVVDRVFPTRYLNPATHEAALAELGQTVRRIHALPVPIGARARDPRDLLTHIWAGLLAGFRVPDFARDAVEGTLGAVVPPMLGDAVLGHNDLNPSNLVYDGQSLLVLDWSTAALADPFFDLATLAVFLRMDQPTCLGLLAAYENGERRVAVPVRFIYMQKLVATFVGTMMLHLARQKGHAGAAGGETLASTSSLAAFYQQMRAGTVNPATPDGQWLFGLALLKESLGGATGA